MERTKVNEVSEVLPLWLKIGGGSMHLGKQIIKPGQKFRARESDIPKAFRDLVILQEEGTATTSVTKIKGEVGTLAGTAHMVRPSNPLIFTKVPAKDEPEFFDVKNRKGKIMNQLPLTSEQADKLIKELQ